LDDGENRPEIVIMALPAAESNYGKFQAPFLSDDHRDIACSLS
jgi:hypothetical protein